MPTFTTVPWGLRGFADLSVVVSPGSGSAASGPGGGFSVQTPYTRPPNAAMPEVVAKENFSGLEGLSSPAVILKAGSAIG